jgi:multidrug efflux pump subunit AcrA (membrane-fusion protein)
LGRDKSSRPWHLYLLGVLAIGAIVLAVLAIGLPSSGARTAREVVTAEDGVVQSTVSGSGNISAGTDLSVNFKTSGTLQSVNVSVGQHVSEGQLIASLDPTSAQLALSQAQEQLVAAEDQLTEAENGTSTGSGSSGASASTGSTGTSNSTGTSASTSYDGSAGTTEFVSESTPKRPTSSTGAPGTSTTTTTTSSTITGPRGKKRTTTKTTTTTKTAPSSSTGSASGTSGKGGGSSGGGGGSGGGTATTSTPNPATIASAQASVYGAQISVNNAEQALGDTKLYAPASGTIASLASLLPGDSITAGSVTSGSSSSSSSSSSTPSTGGSGVAGGTSAAGGLGNSGSSSSSSSSSSPFVEIVNTNSLTMTVAFSESDISNIKVGQPATVTLDALPGVELAARVTQISPVGTTSSGVVSYSSTLTLNQNDSQVKAGMSASASVITGQAQGVTVPNAAVTGASSLGTVNVLSNGKTTQQQVVVGMRGDSRTQIISGLKAGQQLVIMITLPPLDQSTTSTGSSGTLGGAGAGGAGGLGGGGGGGFGGGGFAGARALFRGGG